MEFLRFDNRFPDCKYVEIGYQRMGHTSGEKEYLFSRNKYSTSDSFCADIASLHSDPRIVDLYATYFWYDSKEQSVALKYGYFPIDVDGLPEEWSRTRMSAIKVLSYAKTTLGIDYENIMLFFSGRGIHIMIPPVTLGITPDSRLHEKYKAAGMAIKNSLKLGNMDTQIYEARRVFRLPNSVNHKTGLHKVQITVNELIACAGFNEISVIANSPRGILFPEDCGVIKRAADMFAEISSVPPEATNAKRCKKVTMTGDEPECIKSMLRSRVQHGGRNTTYCALVSHYAQRGLDREEIYDKLIGWRYNNCDPIYDDDDEAWSSVKTIHNGGSWGCTKIRSIGDHCNEDKCKIVRKEGEFATKRR